MKIVKKGNRVLQEAAKELALKDIQSKKVKNLLKVMAELLLESKQGVALAAPQVGESLRIFIVDRDIWENKVKEEKEYSPSPRPPVVFINPVVKKMSKKKVVVSEGCLSVEDLYGTLKRAEKLTIEAYNETGKKFARGVSGFLSQIIQHEMDHLNGVLFIDKALALEKINGK